MSNRIKSLRFSIWGKDGNVSPRDIGEALRDLWTTLKVLTDVRLVKLDGFVWVTPFYIAADHIPAAVLLGLSRVHQQPTYAAGAFVGFTYTPQGIRVDDVPGLTVGTSYDLTFVVIG